MYLRSALPGFLTSHAFKYSWLAIGMAWLWGAHSMAWAQVQRCTDPHTGQVTYTDSACPINQEGVELLPALTPEQQASQEAQYQAARQRWEQEQAHRAQLRQAQAEAAKAAAQAARQPSVIIVQEPAPPAAATQPALVDSQPWLWTTPQRPHHRPPLPHRPGHPGSKPSQQEPSIPFKPTGPEWHCNVFRCTNSQGQVVPRP